MNQLCCVDNGHSLRQSDRNRSGDVRRLGGVASSAGERWGSLQWGGNAQILSVINGGDGMVCEVDLSRDRALSLLGGATLALIIRCRRPLRARLRSRLVRRGMGMLVLSGRVGDGIVGAVLAIWDS